MKRLVLAVSLAAVGCANAPLQTTEYLLRAPFPPDATGAVIEVPATVSIGRVSVAPYIDQPGIVLQTGENAVRAAQQHKWAEPLPAALRSALRGELSSALGTEVRSTAPARTHSTVVDLHVDRLHATMRGTAELEATYRIRTLADSREYRFLSTTPLTREGYGAVVEATELLVRQMAAAIAGALADGASQ